MKPACRCGDAASLHEHHHSGTYCARWDKCGCDKYRAPRRAETPRTALRSVLLLWPQSYAKHRQRRPQRRTATIWKEPAMKLRIRKLLSTTVTPKPPGQCSKITTRGKQCSLPALPGSDRCTLPSHQKQP